MARLTRLLRRNGDGQALAPLGAAPLQHACARRGRHAGPKPVRALPPSIARLIRPLHRETASQNHAPGRKSIFGIARRRRARRVTIDLRQLEHSGAERAHRTPSGVSRARASAAATSDRPPPAPGPCPRRADAVHLLGDRHLDADAAGEAAHRSVLRTPSATSLMLATISASFSPLPSRRPTVRFRDRSPVHVSTRSPRQDSP